MQGRALPQALLIKGGFGWIVDVTEDISPPPANENRRNIAVSPVVVGHHIEISNRFVADYERVIRFMTLGIKIRKRQSAALTTDCQ